jgi:hypothetical protein
MVNLKIYDLRLEMSFVNLYSLRQELPCILCLVKVKLFKF